MVVGVSPCLKLPQVSISYSNRPSSLVRNFEVNLSPFDRLLHPPSIRLLLHHLRAYLALHGGGGPYNPEAHDVPELPGWKVLAELVSSMYGLLQCELRDERLVGLRHRCLFGGGSLSVDAHCTHLHERGEGQDREEVAGNQERGY